MDKRVGIGIALACLMASSVVAAQPATAAQSLGDKWPLTVTDVVVRCERVNGNAKLEAVTATHRGDTYAVNGTAAGQAAARGWRNIAPIWKANPEIPGTKMSIGPLIDYGRQLCR